MTPTYIIALWILAHLWGDYVLQSDWMAQVKIKATAPALAHALMYTLCYSPLILIAPMDKGLWALGVIGVTHFLIDRFRLARYVCWIKNFLGPRETVTEMGIVIDTPIAGQLVEGSRPYLKKPDGTGVRVLLVGKPAPGDTAVFGQVITEWWHPWDLCSGTGYHKDRPPWMAVWLMIIADNTMHLTINIAAILWAVK